MKGIKTTYKIFVSSLLNYVPFVSTSLTGLHVLNFHVPTCLDIFFVPTNLCVLNYFVPTCTHFSRAYMPLTTHKIYWGSLLYHLYCCFSLDYLTFHSIQNPKTSSCFKNWIPQSYLVGFCYLKWCMRRDNNLMTH